MWQTTAALTSRVHPDSRPGQFIVFSSMAGATVMAVPVPQGFEEWALVFAGAWVAVRVSRLVGIAVADTWRARRWEPEPPAPLM